ncbi:hypothetical protein Tco_0176611, partial [Tanacetum coccineum]
EKGEIYFFYRPKVEKEEAHSYDDVQRMYIVLRPESGEKSIEVKQEGSPDTSQGGQGAEFIDIKDALKGEEYETKTRGHRHKPPARALGHTKAST